MGILAGYDTAGVGQLAVQTGAVMVLMPKMVALLMEGLTPISESANEFVKNGSLEESFTSVWMQHYRLVIQLSFLPHCC